ncbi:RluA family pseudouridine synthase [Bdellovibrio svalbardensis]|uniref:RluA family pseudouridine synthase n=1 Tax=Bdellovibrio svalbardensis TaxID=2972972 RepID=A0ABT6DH45_9BACT|nr:RluA family pseudouridine synthase [Bdellovibrio svalbardensis]MDG0816187.1 RluA family pseudouridine synthase [Bdellovibrio svalbardensis]
MSDVILSNTDLDLPQIHNLLNLGAIYLNGQRLQEDFSVSEGAYLRVHTKPRRFPKNDGKWSERIIFENQYFIIVNKISGLPVHASVDNIRENVQAYLEETLNQPVFLTHRLDVPTRGLIVYGKTAEFQTAFNKMLIARELKKIYRARVTNAPPMGFLTHFMEPSPRAPKKVDRVEQPGWQNCVLEVLSSTLLDDGSYEVKIHLHTGRTHQIRAQLGFENCPIIGDHAYGAEKIWEEERIELEACELEFTNPLTGESHHFKI